MCVKPPNGRKLITICILRYTETVGGVTHQHSLSPIRKTARTAATGYSSLLCASSHTILLRNGTCSLMIGRAFTKRCQNVSHISVQVLWSQKTNWGGLTDPSCIHDTSRTKLTPCNGTLCINVGFSVHLYGLLLWRFT